LKKFLARVRTTTDPEAFPMATRTIKSLGKTGRITRAQALKVAREILRASPQEKQRRAKILTPEATASGKGLIRFRVGAPIAASEVKKKPS
jgi:hypothetical protein